LSVISVMDQACQGKKTNLEEYRQHRIEAVFKEFPQRMYAQYECPQKAANQDDT